MSRGLDLSQGAGTGAASITFSGNGTLGLNTNILTLAGDITFSAGTRVQSVRAFRANTVNITGNITQASGTGNFNIGTTAQDPNVDGRGAGTHRFSNLARTFTATPNLLMGIAIIEGSVPVSATNNVASPIGQSTNGLNLTQGNSGNIVGGGNFVGTAVASRDVSVDTIRSVFLETPGSTYARPMTLGNGSATTPNTGGYASIVSIINGFQLGGTHTTGTITFSGNLSNGDIQTGSNNSNVITLGSNLALLAEGGATSVFSGIIPDTSSSLTNARITINQFRNHPNIDSVNNTSGNISSSGGGTASTGSDGIPDLTANQLVGTAKTGTVVLSGANTYVGTTEILGGTLQTGNTRALGFGGRQSTTTGTTTVVGGTALDLNGVTAISEPIILNGTGISSGGALINSSGTPASIGNGIAGIQIGSLLGTGTAYAAAPTVTISGAGTGATATSSLGLTNASITSITSGGTGWITGDTVNITAAGGNGAIGTVTAVGGVVTAINIINPGSGYTGAPTAFTKNTSVAGAGTTTLSGNTANFTVTGVTLTAAGTGYSGTPTYTFGSGDATPGALVLSSVVLASDSSIGGTGDLAISSVISESGGARTLTKVGAGTLTLSAANTYTGATTVSTGVLTNVLPFLADAAGALIGAAGKLNLNFDETGGPVQDVVNSLKIDNVFMAAGTYGATGSGATNIDDTHFAGAGVLSVATSGVETYAIWLTTKFTAGELLDPAVSGPNADPDADGLGNLLEFVEGTEPKTAEQGKGPVYTTPAGVPTITLVAKTSSLSQVTITGQSGTTLLSWPDPLPLDSSSAAIPTAGQTTLVYKGAAPGDPNRFYRLQIVSPTP